MPYPTLHDDGRQVTLDLHGATVEEAVRLAEHTIQAAAARGRHQVKLIHGASTSYGDGRTIKRALHAALDDRAGRGVLARYGTSAWRADGHVLVALDVTRTPNPTRLRLADVQ